MWVFYFFQLKIMLLKCRFLLGCLLLCCPLIQAQTDFGELIPNVLQDVQKFGESYIEPASDAAMHNVNSGWYNSAETKSFPQFEITVISNVTYVPEKGGNFNMNAADYNSIRFEDGYVQKNVASIFGDDKNISVFIDYETEDGLESLEIELPPGVDNGSVNLLPTFYIQGDLGLFLGTELKFRYSPELEIGDISTEIFGVALQHEFTNWIKEEVNFPLNISGLIAFSDFKGEYLISDDDPEETASVVSNLDAWAFSLLASKEIANFTFFGGLDYSVATSTSTFQGLYTLPEEGAQFQSILNQIQIENKSKGLSGTLGLGYSFKYFKTQLSVNLQKYSNVSLGVGYKFGE